MLPLLFASQGSTAPVGGYGGITLVQDGANWRSDAWFGGFKISTFSTSSARDAITHSAITLAGYRASTTDPDPDN